MIELALSYAARGWHVFPLHSPTPDGCDCGDPACEDVGKHPRTKDGLKSATTNVETIRRWWTTWPTANIGLRTGAISGVVVVDVDMGTAKDGATKQGAASLEQAETRNGQLPTTVEARTGSGGRHLFFRHPGGIEIRSTTHRIGPDIDTRGDGGYVVAAPSLHRSGRRYEWANEPGATSIAPLPDWLLTLLTVRPATTNGHAKGTALGETIPKGQRDSALASYAGKMRRGGIPEGAILAALVEMNATQCDPPLPDDQVRKIAWSIGRYEPADPVTEDPVATAREVVERFRLSEPVGEAVKAAMGAPETLGALALVAGHTRAIFEAVLLDLRARGARARDLDALTRAVNGEVRRLRQIRVVGADEPSALPKVKVALPAAPVPDETVVPLGWRLNEQGIARERVVSDEMGGKRADVEMIASAPVVIAGRLKDVGEGSESIRLAFFRDHRWQHETVGRATVANARSLVELAGVGLPVTSATAGDLASYIAAFEAANIGSLPRAHVSRQMGWQGEDGRLGFLWGRTLIRPDGDRVASVKLDAVAPVDWKDDWIAFLGDDVGDEQIADGYHGRGTFDAWRAAVLALAPYPRALLGLYAGLAPPLLLILGTRNFAVDWAYTTSTGKTTVLRVAASCWGCADERAPAAALATWDVSRVWVERASAILNGLPLILDDTKRARNPKMIGQTIYDVVSGRGRGRGSVSGTRRVGTWQTVMLSNGESKMTNFSEDGGTRARVLECWGMPFGAATQATGKVVHALDLAVRHNYGHAGPRLVQFCLSHRDQWEEWRAEYRRVQLRYLERAGDNPIGGRLAETFAVVDMAAGLAHAALDLPWSYHDPIDALYADFVAAASEADRAAKALDYVKSWADGHVQHFFGRHATDPSGKARPPADGWAGRWDRGDEWAWIAFLPHRLRAILREQEFEPDSTIEVWADHGWLVQSKGRSGHEFGTRINGNSTWAIALRRDAFGSADDLAGEGGDDE